VRASRKKVTPRSYDILSKLAYGGPSLLQRLHIL
jgi:hypothetical protein